MLGPYTGTKKNLRIQDTKKLPAPDPVQCHQSNIAVQVHNKSSLVFESI
jgi:hypothetical protein